MLCLFTLVIAFKHAIDRGASETGNPCLSRLPRSNWRRWTTKIPAVFRWSYRRMKLPPFPTSSCNSIYYLGSVFGRGDGRRVRKHLSDRNTDLAYRRFQRIYDQAEGRCAEAVACRERFIRPLPRDTCIAAVLPAGAHTLCGAITEHVDAEAAVTQRARAWPAWPRRLECQSRFRETDSQGGRS